MSHDKLRAAARERMARTGEPYTAARRAAAAGHQAAGTRIPSPGPGWVLRMSDEIHDWLAGLRGSGEPAATRVVNALATLMLEGAGAGDPLVVSTADAWPWALMEALDRSYQERLEGLAELRRPLADAATLALHIQNHRAGLESMQAELEQRRRRALAEGQPQEAAAAAGDLAAAQQQVAELGRLLPGVTAAEDRLTRASQRQGARAEAFRVQKEVLKASCVAAIGSLRVNEALAAAGLAGDDGEGQHEDAGDTISAARARLASLIAQMEREAGQDAWPEGLLELRPGAPVDDDIRILFAAEPPGAALLIAVVEGAEAVADLYLEAVLAAAGLLRQVRAGQAPEAAARTCADPQSFLAEFHPGSAGGSPPDQ